MKDEYLSAYSYIRTVSKYGHDVAFLSMWDLESLPLTVRRAAAHSFNVARKAGVISKDTSGYDRIQNYCPECGRMLFDAKVEDDICARVSAGPFGDIMCSICARRLSQAEDWEQESDYDYDPL